MSDTHNKFLTWQAPNFWLLLLLAIALKQIPYVTIPFNWLESYFHEISHGLAALVSGGSIVQIQLFINGAGLCTTLGGSAFLIAFSGYAGAVAWGVLIYKIADLKSSYSKYFSYFILALLVISSVLWVRDFLTLFICALLIALFLLSVKISHFQLLPLVLKIIALMVLLNSFQSPLYLIDGRGIGDGSALSQLTFIPEFVWIAVWTGLGAISIYRLGRKGKVAKPKG
ncbi:M50 family metallopeptidase [Thalassomonas sp. M1454]|uniref:M50 family metallopeptidase n=1 Tax=Thalassomonas sp. M1454 TaxID=2594477 RepID=UPI00117FF8A5|nr:M50 family metallopeptidase [Thalassomonas sp. M1454]TRX57128.1 M50 family metallopeptidase [Thalassomonas sp. M1454]